MIHCIAREAAMSICTRANVVRFLRFALPALAFAHIAAAKATLITFDDLPPPLPGDFFNSPLNNQYVSKGLLIDGAFLVQPDFGSKNQALWGSEFAKLTFLNALPTFVSLSVSSSLQDQVYVQANGPSFVQTITTSGYSGPVGSTPYQPNALVSFAAPGGISSLYITSFYNTRVDPIVDNLRFGSIPAVPEPPTLLLLGVGVAMFIVAKRKRAGPAEREVA
jgi:hypothetical protein